MELLLESSPVFRPGGVGRMPALPTIQIASEDVVAANEIKIGVWPAGAERPRVLRGVILCE